MNCNALFIVFPLCGEASFPCELPPRKMAKGLLNKGVIGLTTNP